MGERGDELVLEAACALDLTARRALAFEKLLALLVRLLQLEILLLDLREHFVEDVGELAELVVTVLFRARRIVLGLRHVPRRGSQLCDGPDQELPDPARSEKR